MGHGRQLHDPFRPSLATNGSRYLARPAALRLLSARGMALDPELRARARRPWTRLPRAVRPIIPDKLGVELQDPQPCATCAAHVQSARRNSINHLAIAARGEAIREQPAPLARSRHDVNGAYCLWVTVVGM